MLYLVCTMLRKALELRATGAKGALGWKQLMLTPHDFDPSALHHDLTRSLMAKMSFEHGGSEYDAKYPDGIPTSMVITDDQGKSHDSGLVMYPGGHARNAHGPDVVDLEAILDHKFETLGKLAAKDPQPILKRLSSLEKKSAAEIATIMDFPLEVQGTFD
jgi:2-methylcitrate dehydratase